MFAGVNVMDPEYPKLMAEAKAEFDAWEAGKRKNRKIDKAKFKAQRLAKLDALREKFFEEN